MSDERLNNKIEFMIEGEAVPEQDNTFANLERQWEMYVTQLEDARALVSIDLGLVRIAPVPKYNILLGLQIEMQDPDLDGFYTEQEKPLLFAMQERIVEVFETEGYCRFVGTVTTAGNRMLYFYGMEESYLSGLVGKVAAEFADYRISYMIDNDGVWGFYYDGLYPSDLDMQLIKNRQIIEALAGAGFDLDEVQDVSYWFFFQEGPDRRKATSRFISQGFEVLDNNFYDEKMEPMGYGLRVMARHDLNLITVVEKTYICFEILEDYVAIYDGWEVMPNGN